MADGKPDLRPGEYDLVVTSGEISLRASGASRTVILDDLSSRIGFDLYYSPEIDLPVTLDLPVTGLPSLLEALLAGLPYTATYDAQTDDNGFRIAELSIAAPGTAGERGGESSGSTGGSGATASPLQPSTGYYLGPDPEDEKLAATLEYGTLEDRIEAISEITLDPAGLQAAWRVYTGAVSPAIRVAVLELIEGEETWLAKSMVANSLLSADPDEVRQALSIVDAQSDYSLAPQVMNLRQHYDPDIRALAEEVLQSIVAEYADPAGADDSTLSQFPGISPADEADHGGIR